MLFRVIPKPLDGHALITHLATPGHHPHDLVALDNAGHAPAVEAQEAVFLEIYRRLFFQPTEGRPTRGCQSGWNTLSKSPRRAGVRGSQSFQPTRWYDGSVFTWFGARKQAGRGESSGRLKYDQIRPKRR